MFRPSRREALWLVTSSGLAFGCQDDEDRVTSAANGGENAGAAGASDANDANGGQAEEPATAGGEGGRGGAEVQPGGAAGEDGHAGAGSEGGAPDACQAKPQQTLGPFPNKEQLLRSDIRSGQEGTALRLRLRVVSLLGCAPLRGAIVELWQCNAAGNYSEYAAFGTADQGWLRGYQVTDEDGVVEFLTIYPGWYPGRAVHLHFRVTRAGQPDFVSQLYFDDALSDAVLSQPPYTSHVGVRPRNTQDSIFVSDGGPALVLRVTPHLGELRSVFEIALPA